MKILGRAFIAAILVGLSIVVSTSLARGTTIVLQSTTSTQNSGLFDHILPIFAAETGIKVKVVAVGTGQALKNGRNGDGDVLLVHAKTAEQEFVRAGYGTERFDVMYNDFVVVGPADDPAGVSGIDSIVDVFRKIAQTRAPFASRGDDSGTNKKEISLWQLINLDPVKDGGKWYRETGSGMGATLNIANGMGAYTLTDRATWISFENKGDLKILSEGDRLLFNQYGIILVNPERHPHVQASAGSNFIAWLTGEKGRAAISSYRLNGQQLFFPNSK